MLAHQCLPYSRSTSQAGAQRMYELARALPEFGWRLEVLCCPTSPEDDGATTIVPGGSIVRAIRPGGDTSRVTKWQSALSTSVLPGAKLASRAVTAAYLSTRGDWSAAWRPIAEQCALTRIEAGRRGAAPVIDALVGEHSPDAGLLAACRVSRLTAVPVLMDFRDPVLLPFQDKAAARVARVMYRFNTRGAVAVANVQTAWADADERMFGVPSFHVPHGYAEHEVLEAGLPVELDTERFRIVFYGGIYDFYELGLVAEATANFVGFLSNEQRQLVEIEYFGTSGHRLFEAMEAQGVMMKDRGLVSKRDLLRCLDASAIVVLPTVARGSDRMQKHSGFPPSKLFETLPLACPVVACPGDGSTLDEFCRETGAAAIAETGRDLTQRLVSAFRHWQRGERDEVPSQRTGAVETGRYTRRFSASRLATALSFVVSSGA